MGLFFGDEILSVLIPVVFVGVRNKHSVRLFDKYRQLTVP